ncbi:MAG: hypothetical protein O3A00_24905 [Planctomycetota bacterium]|nr:hypothetical protein [Planctomycetota bacterium]
MHTPATAAVDRDIKDVLNLGHWSNFAQKHHFMRRFDGQSPLQAYAAACDWIRSNALKYAQAAVVEQGGRYLPELGSAVHALEDSFSAGHVERVHMTDSWPGTITDVEVYDDSNQETHSDHDERWMSNGKFTMLGRNAVNAVKALFKVIFDEVLNARSLKRTRVTGLTGWSGFQSSWLAIDTTQLSAGGAHKIDLIDKFVGRWSTDESGLATAMYTELGQRTHMVRRLIERLDEHHNTDADDVVEIYVNRLRQADARPVRAAVATNKKLIDLMVKVLDEGYTTDGEYECIGYLRGISAR